MSQEEKPKATLIKQNKITQNTVNPVNSTPVLNQNQETTVEKKKVIRLKKKPTVVKIQTPVVKKEEPAVEPEPPKEETVKSEVVKEKETVKTETVKTKAVEEKKSALNNNILRGPVIISGDNLPPLVPESAKKPTLSRKVGYVGGVSYNKKPELKRKANNSSTNNQVNRGVYTPKSSQNKSSGFKNFNKNSYSGDVNLGSEKNKRVYSKDKGKDRRHEATEDELELKTFKKKSSEPVAVVAKNVDIMSTVTVSDLAKKMNVKASELVKKLFDLGKIVNINQSIDSDEATILAAEYGCEVHIIDLYEETVIEKEEDKAEDLKPRAPIVTVMGHVDHGKTKLLDAIRATHVTEAEFGGITQHIGAYKVSIPEKGDIVFLDTPGHAAFTMMRARGAQLTDIVVLVVAANDGVMPQTLEALDHAKAAKVPVIVAINKCDLPDAKPERVMQQLSDKGLLPEEWGGDTLYCEISAKEKKGIDKLLENILLQAEVLELKANPNCRAEGKVVEARIDQGRGTVATVMIQRGTLKQGDYFVSGIYPGRVRAMFDDTGKKIKEAGPSTPVEVIGLSDIPSAGDPFQVCVDEKQARQIGAKRQELKRQNRINNYKDVNNQDKLLDLMQEAHELNLIIKGDVQGSVEALQAALEKLSTSEVSVKVIRAAAGAIIEDDINLASASENPALVIGFNVRPTPKAQLRAEEEKIDVRKYNVIYNVVDDVKALMEGMLAPEITEIDVGRAAVRQVFKVPKVGLIAGCYINSGSVNRNNYCRVIRESIQISKDLIKISSLKRFKDDAREVTEGFECGIGLENFHDIKEGDELEFVELKEVTRKLSATEERI